MCVLTCLYIQSTYAVSYPVADITGPVKGHQPTALPAINIQTPAVGDKIKVNPNFFDVDDDGFSRENTLYEWQVKYPAGWKTIKSGMGNEPGIDSLLVEEDYIGYEIRVGVRPSNYSSVSDPYLGVMSYSAETSPTQGRAPVAANLTIAGTTIVGQELIGNYTFSDKDGDREGKSIYKWFSGGQVIQNATEKTYTIRPADQGKQLAFSIIPISATGTPSIGKVKCHKLSSGKSPYCYEPRISLSPAKPTCR